MAIFNPLSWQNENGLSGYPFNESLGTPDLIVDAKFVQFDNFVPVLNSVTVDSAKLILNITFDKLELPVEFNKSKYLLGDAYRCVRIYEPTTNRYLGTVVFGSGAEQLWEQAIGQVFKYNTPFSVYVVRSIPSKDAVYLFDSMYGDITLSKENSDKSIFYNVSEELNTITFNAVFGHSAPEPNTDSSAAILKKINLVPPTNNNINLASNDVIKINPVNSAYLEISLLAGTKGSAFLIPSLIA